MFLTEPGLAQARAASSYSADVSNFHNLAAAPSSCGICCCLIELWPWLPHFHPWPCPWICRSWRWSCTVNQENRHRGWKGSVCLVHSIQSSSPDWPGQTRYPLVHILTLRTSPTCACQVWLFNALHCHCIWSSVTAGTCGLAHCPHPVQHSQW